MIYLSAFLVNFTLAFLELSTNKKKILRYISFLFVFIFLGGAYNIGADWLNYFYNYESISAFKFGEKITQIEAPKWIDFEIGFQYYTSIMKTFLSFDNYRIISNLIDLLIIYKLSTRYTKYTCIFIFIFFGLNLYALEIEAMRQIKAILIFIYSIKFLEKSQFFKYSFSILCASFFHKTIIVCLLIYFFKNIKLNNKRTYLYVIMILIFSPFIETIIKILVLKVEILSKYSVYLQGYYSENRSINLINLIKNMVLIFPYILTIKYTDELNKIKHYNIINFLSYIYISLLILSYYMRIFERFALYFCFFYYINWTYIFYLNKRKKLKIFMLIFYSIISMRQSIMLNNAMLVKNYQNIIFDTVLNKKLELNDRVNNNNIGEVGEKHLEKLKKN